MDCEINIHVNKENLIEFYYSNGMDCPIDECTEKYFTSKKKLFAISE